MCEYQKYNKRNIEALPVCKITRELCTFCVLGNANTYNKAKEAENSNEKEKKEADK